MDQNQNPNPFFPQPQDTTPQPTPVETPAPVIPPTAPAAPPLPPLPVTPTEQSAPITPATPTTPVIPPTTPPIEPAPSVVPAAPTPNPFTAPAAPTPPVAPTPAGTPRNKKMLLTLIIVIGGIIVLGVIAFFGLKTYANTAASNYGNKLAAALKSSSVQSNLTKFQASVTSSSDDDSVVASGKAANTGLISDIATLKKSVPKLAAAPLGSKLSSNYKTATSLQTQFTSFLNTLDSLTADTTGYFSILTAVDNLDTAVNNDSSDLSQYSTDIKNSISQIQAIKEPSDDKDLQTSVVTTLQGFDSNIDAFIANPDDETAYNNIENFDVSDIDSKEDTLSDKLSNQDKKLVQQASDILKQANSVK